MAQAAEVVKSRAWAGLKREGSGLSKTLSFGGLAPVNKQTGGDLLRSPPVQMISSRAAGYGVRFTSTLLPTTPPRIPPIAAPMRPPLTLSRLVVAPITAPA